VGHFSSEETEFSEGCSTSMEESVGKMVGPLKEDQFSEERMVIGENREGCYVEFTIYRISMSAC
jgi:hypothetical protein